MHSIRRTSFHSLLTAARTLGLPLVMASALWAGCGGGSPSGMQPVAGKRGYVTCGSVTCNPGQFCNNLLCQAGCQSNDNCAENQTCEDISTVSHIGTCQNVSSPDMSTPKDSLARCKDSCLALVTCSLISVSEGSGCQSDCASLADNQRTSFSTCVESWSCQSSPVPGCLSPIECGGSFKCSGGQSCVNHKCR